VIEEFSPQRAETAVRHLANPAPVLRVSAKKGDGMKAWLKWLRAEVTAQRARGARGETVRPAMQRDGIRLHAGG
jgi:hydrogenase nickel incorporation protein HypB